jgi:nitrous oxidase accessory protein NosD
VFEDIIIQSIRITIEATAPAPRQMIFANTSGTAGIVFNRLTIAGNEILNRVPSSSAYAIELRRIQYSTVAGNAVRGVTNGIHLAWGLLRNEVRDNVVEAGGTAYRLAESLGENKAYNNYILGSPQTHWQVSGLQASDSVETEQKSPSPQ